MPPILDLRDCAIPVVRRQPVTSRKRVYTNPCDEKDDSWCRVGKVEQEGLAHPRIRKSYSGQVLKQPLSPIGPQPRHILSIKDLEGKFKDLEIRSWVLGENVDGLTGQSHTPAPLTDASGHVVTPSSAASSRFTSRQSRAKSSQAGSSHRRAQRSRLNPTAQEFQFSTYGTLPREPSPSPSRCRPSEQWPPLVITPEDLETHGFHTVRRRQKKCRTPKKEPPPSSSSSEVPAKADPQDTPLPSTYPYPTSAWPPPAYSGNSHPAQTSPVLGQAQHHQPSPFSAAAGGPSGGIFLVSNPTIDHNPENASTFWGPFDVFANTGNLRPRSESFAGVGDGKTRRYGEREEGMVDGAVDHGYQELGALNEERSPEQEPAIYEGNATDVPDWLVSSAFYQPQGHEVGVYGLVGQELEREKEQMKRVSDMSFGLQILRRRGMRVSSSDSLTHDQN